jgi:hypothetical protein
MVKRIWPLAKADAGAIMVRFCTTANLVAELTEAQHDQNLLKLQKSIAKLD